MSTTATDHVATITDLYAAFGRGDIPSILDALAEDVRWEQWEDNTAQQEGVSHLQPRIGREGVAQFFAVSAGARSTRSRSVAWPPATTWSWPTSSST